MREAKSTGQVILFASVLKCYAFCCILLFRVHAQMVSFAISPTHAMFLFPLSTTPLHPINGKSKKKKKKKKKKTRGEGVGAGEAVREEEANLKVEKNQRWKITKK
uniref:Uncharacterized protein n=1 Tax=Trypanosoma vivax (strain Y486) TaxID=1055687 RepID=G0TTJ2_TRYVY|nr:hypothetical protein, unlikely [Trypanosoma vivax Y486]